MTSTLTTFRPPWAITCWTHNSDIIVELPATNGDVYHMKFPATESGLSKALNFLRTRERAERPLNPDKIVKQTIAKIRRQEARPAAMPDAGRSAILRKLGMI